MDKEQQQQPPASVSSLKSFFEQDVAKKAPQQTHLRGAKSRPPSSTVATTVPVNKPVSVTRGQKKPPPDKPVKPKHLKQQSPLSASSSSTSFAYVNPETFNKAPFTAYQEHNSPGRNSLQRGPQESLENPFDGSPGTSPSKSVVTARLGNSNPFDDGDTNVAPPPLAIRPNVPPQQIVNSTSNNLLKPPGPSEEKRKMERKPSQEELHRQAILKELKESEEAFLSDMRLLVEIYLVPARQRASIFAPQDIKILFSNAEAIVLTSEAFLSDVCEGLKEDQIGKVFHKHMKALQATYGDYCKNHDDAIDKVGEYSKQDAPERIREFLADCQKQLQGRTGAWDLSSLIIKPVQRVLKYPLLVKQLIKCTPPSHPDYTVLEAALGALEDVAERINDLKKRKDLVDKYTEQKGVGNVMHGITKRLTRGTQQLKLATGLAEEATKDEFYEALFLKFDSQHKAWLNLEKVFLGWTKAVKEFLESQELLARSFEETYHVGLDDPSTPRPPQLEVIRRYRQTCFQLSAGPWKEADFQIKTEIRPLVVTILGNYNDPVVLIKKRDAKRLDFERVNGLKAKGDQIDKALLESADTYVSLHEQLVEELPQFIAIMNECMNVLLTKIVSIQAGVYESIRKAFSRLEIETGQGDTLDTTFARLYEIGGPLEVASRELSIAHKWRSDVFGVPSERTPSNSTPGDSPLKPQKPSITRPNSALIDLSENGNDYIVSTAPPLKASKSSKSVPTRVDSRHSSASSSLRPTPTKSSSNPQQAFPQSKSTPILTETSFEAIVIYPFQAEGDELALELGQIVVVSRTTGRGNESADESWWFGEHTRSGNSGWFPSNFVRRRA